MSATRATVGAASRFPADGGRLDLLDKAISAPFFRLLLGLPAEALLSVPGCFFGMPLFGLPGALLQALAAADAVPLQAWAVFAALFGAVLCVWFAFLAQRPGQPRAKQLAHILYGKHTVLGAPLLAICVLRTLQLPTAGSAHFFLLSWYVAITPVLVVKALTKRRRPLASSAEALGASVASATGQSPGLLACTQPALRECAPFRWLAQ